MERTQTEIVNASAPERHELANDIDDLGSVDDLIYGLLVDQIRWGYYEACTSALRTPRR